MKRKTTNVWLDTLQQNSINNKYLCIYVQLCERALERTEISSESVIESHHIVPVSYKMAGEKDKENRVMLTGREHFIAHKLLTKFCKNEFQKQKSLHALAFFYTSAHGRKLNSRQIEESKKARSIAVSGSNNYFFGKKLTGSQNGFYGKKHTEENKQKQRERLLGKTREELYGKERADKISSDHSKLMTENNPFKGKKHSETSKAIMAEKIKLLIENRTPEDWARISESLKKQPLYKCANCDMTTTKANITRWHNDNCKLRQNS